MAFTTISVQGLVTLPTDTSAEGYRLKFQLRQWDKDSAVVVPEDIYYTIPSGGNIDVQLWPNARGIAGTVYYVYLVPPREQDPALPMGTLTVPDVAGPINMWDHIDTSPPPTLSDAEQAEANALVYAGQAASSASAAATSASSITDQGGLTGSFLQVQKRRGTTSEHASFTGALGEITVDTDKKVPVIHDGATSGGFPLARPIVINMQEWGAVADNVTDNTPAILAAAAAAVAAGMQNYVLAFPAAASQYYISELQFTSAHNHPLLMGLGGWYAARLRVEKTSALYGIDFDKSDNSWGGLHNIRVETTSAFDSVVRCEDVNNAFQVSAFISGGGTSDHALFIDGGSYMRSEFLYTTGCADRNIKINANGNVIQYVFENGNHDVGTNGIMELTSAFSGSGVLFLNQRMEGVGGKDLIEINTTNNCFLMVSGRTVSGTANSIVRKVGGSGPRVDMRLDCDNTPTNWYLDDTVASNTIPAAVGYGRVQTFDLYQHRDIRMMMNSSGVGGYLRFLRSGGNTISVWPDAAELNFRDDTANQYFLVGGARGIRIGDYRQPDTGKEGVQISNNWDLTIDGGDWDEGHLRLGNYHIWVDSAGDLRIKNGAPTSSTDGTVVGTQT